ncbi:MAG TPA: hypothetical protein VKT54_13890, partial [Steroidobacteraceae bacterium]|nr:hypothetical protein [Steroidobacteraceae bacterium]
MPRVTRSLHGGRQLLRLYVRLGHHSGFNSWRRRGDRGSRGSGRALRDLRERGLLLYVDRSAALGRASSSALGAGEYIREEALSVLRGHRAV